MIKSYQKYRAVANKIYQYSEIQNPDDVLKLADYYIALLSAIY